VVEVPIWRTQAPKASYAYVWSLRCIIILIRSDRPVEVLLNEISVAIVLQCRCNKLFSGRPTGGVRKPGL
jgi:hypothetical protein